MFDEQIRRAAPNNSLQHLRGRYTCMSFADSSFSYAYVIYLTVPRRSRFGADAATIQLHLDARNRAVRLFHLLLFSLNVEVNEMGERNLRVMSH